MEYAAMMEVFAFIKDNGLLTPGILAIAIGGVAYQLSKALRDLQTETKELSRQQAMVASSLSTTVAILQRIDEHGTKAELRHRENQIGRWEAAHERVAR